MTVPSPAHYWSVWTRLHLFLQPPEQPWQPQAQRAPSEIAPGFHSPVNQQHTRASTGCCPEEWDGLSQGHSQTQEFSGSVGVIFCWLTAEFYSTLNATVPCCRVQQLLHTPTFPTCNQTGVTRQSTSTVAKQTWLQFQNLPGAFLPSVLFILLSLSWKKALHSYQK